MAGAGLELWAQNLECQRGDAILFSGVNFRLVSGQILQVEGANGSGKTSLLRILAGLSPPSAGDVLWRGERIGRRRAAFSEEIAYLGHQLGLKAELSVRENLHWACALKARAHGLEQVGPALARVGLAGREDVPVRALSAGQRQRIGLARLVSSGAALWILDEPFTALDAAGIAVAHQLLEEHVERGGLAVVTSHQAIQLRTGPFKLQLG